ncbi:IAA-amino acid hydrolase ILR1-like 7-like protein [Drosera capensis]
MQGSDDPVLAAATAIISLQNIISREVDPFAPQVIRKQAAVYQCSAEIDSFGGDTINIPLGGDTINIPPIINAKLVYEHAMGIAHEIVGEENTRLASISMGSEDFAFYLDKVPGCFLFLGIRNPRTGSIHPPHSPYYKIDEDILPIGAALHATFALSLL